MKILIVDDNQQAREMIKRHLQDLSDITCECEDGSEALPVYRHFLPDWVLMDWEMKRVNGLEATREVLADFPNARILLVTNYDDDDLRQAAGEAGTQGFILKDNLIALKTILKTD